MTTPFDPNAYMNLQTDASFETSYTPVPENEYPAAIDTAKLEVVKFKDKDTGVEEHRLVGRIIWNILDDAVKAALGMTKVVVRQDVFIDLTPTGQFDTAKNKNIDLGRIREALGQNSGPWSFQMLNGAGPAYIKVTQRPDKNDSSKIYNDVKGVRKFAQQAAA
jgi:hypothetical protein